MWVPWSNPAKTRPLWEVLIRSDGVNGAEGGDE